MKNAETTAIATNSRKLDAIKALTAAGYTLIPLRGKIPTVKDWVETPHGKYGPSELIGCNYGIALGAEDLVVDVDPRNFDAGDKPVSRLIEDLGAPLKSFTVRTGGGGLHIYFKKPASVSVCNTLKAYGKGVEFKSAGRQVVGPGSIHPDSGKEYMIIAGSCDEIAAAPKALIELIRKMNVPNFETDRAGTGEYKNDAVTQGRFVSFLQDVAEPSVSRGPRRRPQCI